MSAFLCSDDHIRLLALQATRPFGGRLMVPDGFDLVAATRAARVLYDANVAALRDRYGLKAVPRAPSAPTVTADDAARLAHYAPVVVLKSCDCYEYQACEWREYDNDSHASRIVRDAREAATRRLPGYDDAPWGIE
jgi:hypothetical protein